MSPKFFVLLQKNRLCKRNITKDYSLVTDETELLTYKKMGAIIRV